MVEMSLLVLLLGRNRRRPRADASRSGCSVRPWVAPCRQDRPVQVGYGVRIGREVSIIESYCQGTVYIGKPGKLHVSTGVHYFFSAWLFA